MRTRTTSPMPPVKTAAGFGNTCAFEHASPEEFMAVKNQIVFYENEHFFTLRRNRIALIILYEVRLTSLVFKDVVLQSIERAFSLHNFCLFRALVQGVPLDEWIIQFEESSRIITTKLRSSNAGKEDKGDWTIEVAAVTRKSKCLSVSRSLTTRQSSVTLGDSLRSSLTRLEFRLRSWRVRHRVTE